MSTSSPSRRKKGRAAPSRRAAASARRASQGGGMGEAMRELAGKLGIQLSYISMGGKERKASTETLRRLFELWGISAESESEAREALHEYTRCSWQESLEPAIVAWEGEPLKVTVRVRADREKTLAKCQLHLENGERREIDLGSNRLRTRQRLSIDGETWLVKQFSCGALPFGYHKLVFECGQRCSRSLIISAPKQTYSPPEGIRSWGLFLPMYAAHSANSWGAGNLGDWERLGNWTAAAGGRVLSTLPLTAAFLKAPLCEPSPYSPASRLFWNEFYLDIERLPEFAACRAAQRLLKSPSFQAQLRRFRASPQVDYCAEAAVRREVLELLGEFFFANVSARRRDFEEFLRERPTVRDYARFRAATEKIGQSWHTWELRLKRGKLEKGDFDPRVEQYHLYAQWQAERQIAGLIKRFKERRLELYLDLPVGVHPDGYDVWRERDTFAMPASVGAPPDPCFTKGQDWGFAPLHPARMREQRYRYFIEFLRFQMRHVGMLRIDHVMGLHRLYWIPPGLPASEGAYVRYPAEELHAILSVESHRNRTVLVGENLGTVPPEVTVAMAMHEMRQTYVVQYELSPDSRKAVRVPPEKSVASLNTHDMPTFAAYWAKEDIRDRSELGLLKGDEVRQESRTRDRVKNALAAFLKKTGSRDHHEILKACLEWLARGPAEVVQINLEDLWNEVLPQNVPGTSVERPNWRRKARLTLEEIESFEELREVLSALTELRAGVPRKKR